MSEKAHRGGWQPEHSLLFMVSFFASLISFLYYSRQGALLLYGDAVAHINIARRIFDSLTPGPLQMGTVWLPLPHLAIAPFIVNDRMWSSGVGAAIPSMIAYVAGVFGVYRLARKLISVSAAWFAAAAYAFNPNLLYIQTTAMGESIYLAFMVWAVVFAAEFAVNLRALHADEAIKAARRCSVALIGAMLTRYDGWFLAALTCGFVLHAFLHATPEMRSKVLRPMRTAMIAAALFPVLWLAYNYGVYGNGLAFANGPYSAKAIAERTTPPGDPHHPGYHNVLTAAVYFVKAAKLNAGAAHWGDFLMWAAAMGTLLLLVGRARMMWLLLWAPLPFYMLSIAYGSVPIFMPVWWPFSYYNVRYGLQLLPAMVIFSAVLLDWLKRSLPGRAAIGAVAAMFVMTGVCYATTWREPICLQEARVNSRTRIPYEQALAAQLEQLPKDSRLLMFTGVYSGALQRAQVHFNHVINEGNYGIWEQALAVPAQQADFIIASDGDDVDAAVKKHHEGLFAIAVIHGNERPATTIYKSTRKH